MATCQDIINSAFRLIHVYEKGRTPKNDESENARTLLNDLLEMLSNNGQIIYNKTNETQSITANTGSYTIGSGATWDTTRPNRITNVYVMDSNNLNTPLTPLSNDEYQNIRDKTLTNTLPSHYFYDPAYPNGTIYFHPIPSTNLTCGLTSYNQFTAFAALTTDVSLPPGYQLFLKYELAVLLAPEYHKEASRTVVAKSREFYNKIMALNVDNITKIKPWTRSRGAYNVYTDE